MRLLETQGVKVILPHWGDYIDADIVILPLEGSPEEKYYAGSLSRYRGPLVYDEDPLRALVYAITYPRRGFNRLVFGVDPGGMCGVASIGDSLVIHASKVDCSLVGPTVKALMESIPAERREVYAGNGHGLARAAASLARCGIAYGIVDETGTSRFKGRRGFNGVVRDRDIIAGIAIALRGAYGVERLDSSLHREA